MPSERGLDGVSLGLLRKALYTFVCPAEIDLMIWRRNRSTFAVARCPHRIVAVLVTSQWQMSPEVAEA
jgi:hypothetical protein